MFNFQNAYVQSQITTQTPERLVLVVYDGIRKSLRKALLNLERKDVEGAHRELVRAQDLLGELSAALDPQYEVSVALKQLYDFLSRRILAANISKNPQDIEAIIPFVEELKTTWEEALAQLKK
ncbi:MAG TPA: flagellar export chaperone FliS [Firmicutes bacterium]|nr:flagellar export chaperone FliS [Bacillota bacterium]